MPCLQCKTENDPIEKEDSQRSSNVYPAPTVMEEDKDQGCSLEKDVTSQEELVKSLAEAS